MERAHGTKQVEITWAQAPDVEIVSFEQAGGQVTPEITAFRDAWLGSKALRPLPKIEYGAGCNPAHYNRGYETPFLARFSF